jgi:hypothetical protein
MESFQSAILAGVIGLGLLASLVWAGFISFEAFKFVASFI